MLPAFWMAQTLRGRPGRPVPQNHRDWFVPRVWTPPYEGTTHNGGSRVAFGGNNASTDLQRDRLDLVLGQDSQKTQYTDSPKNRAFGCEIAVPVFWIMLVAFSIPKTQFRTCTFKVCLHASLVSLSGESSASTSSGWKLSLIWIPHKSPGIDSGPVLWCGGGILLLKRFNAGEKAQFTGHLLLIKICRVF